VEIEIKIDNGVKAISGRNWQEIFDDIKDAEVDLELLQQIFNDANSDRDLIREFRKLNSKHSPVNILFEIIDTRVYR